MLRGPFAKLCNLGDDEAALSFWEISFLKIMEVRRYDVFLFVEKVDVSCVLGSTIGLSDKPVDLGFGLLRHGLVRLFPCK